MATTTTTDAVLDWYDRNARNLPWRRPDASPWAVLVSEVMLQQTPVTRVLPAYAAWLERWPTPRTLAAASPGEAVRQWGNLGYPRRALRLHAAARQIVDRHGGDVPAAYATLRELPGVGAYTAAAVASFAFGDPQAVVDTNVRRVLARAWDGVASPPRAATAAEARRARALLPRDPGRASRWSVAVMELGALVCTSRSPKCGECPLAPECAWRLAGKPAPAEAPPRGQRYQGTDRHVRGRLLEVLRASDEPVGPERLAAAWEEPAQRERALAALAADGLVRSLPDGRYALPG